MEKKKIIDTSAKGCSDYVALKPESLFWQFPISLSYIKLSLIITIIFFFSTLPVYEL